MKLKEIAAMSNVSPSTVSLVLNNRGGVSAEKRKQIQKLLEEYGYLTHNTDADPAKPIVQKNIRFIKYKRHGMLVDGNPGFINSLVDAVELECRQQNYTLLMTICSEEQLSATIKTIDGENTAGVLLLGTELTDEEALQLSSVSVPLVILDTYIPNVDCNCITMNNFDAICHSVEYLSRLGHSKIGFLANSVPSNNCLERKNAFPQALKRQGLAFDPALVYEVYPTPDGAYNSICTLLEKGMKVPPALVANNDSIALGAIKALKEFQIRIPADVSVIGFDNIPFSNISEPPLTTMDVSCKEMGIWAVRLLCDRIQYPFSATTKMRVSTKLLIRESTAPAH